MLLVKDNVHTCYKIIKVWTNITKSLGYGILNKVKSFPNKSFLKEFHRCSKQKWSRSKILEMCYLYIWVYTWLSPLFPPPHLYITYIMLLYIICLQCYIAYNIIKLHIYVHTNICACMCILCVHFVCKNIGWIIYTIYTYL